VVARVDSLPVRGLLPATVVHAAVAAGLFWMGATTIPDTPVPVIEIMLGQPTAAPATSASPQDAEAEPVSEAAVSAPLPATPKPRPRARAATARSEPAPAEPAPAETAPAETAPAETVLPGVADAEPQPVAPAPAALAPPVSEMPTSDYAPVLLDWLGRHRDYPRAARLRRQEGTPHIALTLDRAGRLLDLTLAKASGVAILDAAALDMARRAAPFPPPVLPRDTPAATFVVPVRFALER
jgi:protein TonB